MKYIVILGDGMSDERLPQLSGKTPMEAAATPALDTLAQQSVLGLAQTVPEGFTPGSDVANLAILGYDPRRYFTGRAPLEALSLGVPMTAQTQLLRMNLVTLSEHTDFPRRVLLDHAGSGISGQDADALLRSLAPLLQSAGLTLYPGMGYRHLAAAESLSFAVPAPPHDHLGEPIGQWLPEDKGLQNILKHACELLENHPVNVRRAEAGLGKANGIWFWGSGKPPEIPAFSEKTNLKGAIVSAVDLLKGIGLAAGMTVLHVPGADGTLESNLEGKAQAAVNALLSGGFDFVYVHMEAPDEMSHQGDVQKKVCAIEQLDRRLTAPIQKAMDASGEAYRLLILPDHGCSVRLRTHTSAPVPFLLYDSRAKQSGSPRFTEAEAAAAGLRLQNGTDLLTLLTNV